MSSTNREPAYQIIHGDCLEVLRGMESNSVDAVIEDGPYGLGKEPDALAMLMDWLETGHHEVKGRGFMGKEWDAFVPQPAQQREVLRVLKPGGHLLAFAGTRTQDLMALGLRIAGFEIRDLVAWVYGSGFPKSHNVANEIDKKMGCEPRGRAIPTASTHLPSGKYADEKLTSNPVEEYEAHTEAGKEWQGWGTALKPALEPITLARKPLDGTIASTVLKWHTGALNIDAGRVPTESPMRTNTGNGGIPVRNNEAVPRQSGIVTQPHELGRWPANLIHDGSQMVLDLFPISKSGARASGVRKGLGYHGATGDGGPAIPASEGSAARFFYCPKATDQDREEGLEMFDERQSDESRKEGNPGGDNPRNRGLKRRKNPHPTVKPIALMRYLCKLITPPGGLILDPFAGSGSTGKAAVLEGFDFIGIEREAEYVEIARARIEHALKSIRRAA